MDAPLHVQCGADCYIPETRSKFWGFAQVNIDWVNLTQQASGLYELCSNHGLNMQVCA